MKRRVLFNKASAACWLVLGIISFPLGWASSVVLVWIASVYANVKTDWGAAEAADDSTVLDKLSEIQKQVDSIGQTQKALLQVLSNQSLNDLDLT